jgi:hypothetical protein
MYLGKFVPWIGEGKNITIFFQRAETTFSLNTVGKCDAES